MCVIIFLCTLAIEMYLRVLTARARTHTVSSETHMWTNIDKFIEKRWFEWMYLRLAYICVQMSELPKAKNTMHPDDFVAEEQTI